MSYFPYAFPKLFVGTGSVATTGTSADLAAKQLGIFSANTNEVVTTSNKADHPYVYIAQGSDYDVDNVGNMTGGTPLRDLKKSRKTQGVNAKYVLRFYKVASRAPKNHKIFVGFDPSKASADAPKFEAGKTYTLYVEAKGSQALRVINRQMYKHVPFYTGDISNDCLTDCEKEYTDAALVMRGWADYINADPVLSMFVKAQAVLKKAATTATFSSGSTAITVASGTGIAVGDVIKAAGFPEGTTVAAVSGTSVTASTNSTAAGGAGTPIVFTKPITSSYVASTDPAVKATVVAGLALDFGYVDTVFGNCSFNPTDYYQIEPLIGSASLVDNSAEAKGLGVKINSSTKELVYTVQAPVIAQGLGETILREYNLSREYEGIHFQTNARKREVESDPVFSTVDRSKFYNRYYMHFTVPVFNNFTNTFTPNTYMLCFAFESGASTTAFETLVSQWLAAHNPTVTLQTLA